MLNRPTLSRAVVSTAQLGAHPLRSLPVNLHSVKKGGESPRPAAVILLGYGIFGSAHLCKGVFCDNQAYSRALSILLEVFKYTSFLRRLLRFQSMKGDEDGNANAKVRIFTAPYVVIVPKDPN
jgi:hypothetical protein